MFNLGQIFNKKEKQLETVKTESSTPSPSTQKKIKPVVLLILDGWGIAPPSAGNAITQAKTPNMDSYPSLYPSTQLIASGEVVGLPASEEGNSEVGHLTLGVGRTVLQSLERIDDVIEDRTFFENPAFAKTINYVKQNRSRLHLMGLISSGEVHSSINHFYALLDLCQQNQLNNVALHLFTDGRDAPPKEAINLIAQIEERLKQSKAGQIATISGRYFAMDRDRRWDRTEKAYRAIVLGQGQQAGSAVEVIKKSYDQGKTDEFIEPTVIVQNGQPLGLVNDRDGVIFFNFRIDRPRQLTMAFVLKDFENLKSFQVGYDPYKEKYEKKGGEETLSGKTFSREKWPQGLFFTSMTEYQVGLPVNAIAFPPTVVKESLPEVLSQKGLRQFHLAESEKERMVTYYFRGLKEEILPNEEVLIIPSPKVAAYDRKPEMSVFKLVEELKKALKRGVYHFLVVNFANPDMVAHSGQLKAAIKACEFVDRAVGEVVKSVLEAEGTILITADHGNVEELLSYKQKTYFYTTSKGEMDTEHSSSPVPLIVINQQFENQQFQGKPLVLNKGSLRDVAPTIFKLMGLGKPMVMTGQNLLILKKGETNA